MKIMLIFDVYPSTISRTVAKAEEDLDNDYWSDL